MHKVERTDYTEQGSLVEALRRHLRDGSNIKQVKLVETHISWVLLAGRFAYKIKKALNLGFLDFSQLTLRQFYCAEEIRLNRRLAPGLYKDVISIGGTADCPTFGTEPVLEYAVRMRRFPSSKQFNLLLAKNQLLPQHIDSLADTVAEFHLQLPPLSTNSLFGSIDAIKLAAEQNFNQMQDLLTDQVLLSRLLSLRKQSELAFIKCRKWFEMRREQGYVRECHGDLHLGNIVLLKQRAVPFDGIEFNPDLRWIDVMSDVAFTVMDLQHHQRADFASRLLNHYLEITGDYEGVKLLPFYIAYRAMVRAKVVSIRTTQEVMTQRALLGAGAELNDYLGLVADCYASKQPVLIITHGLPGSGKTTLSQSLLEQLGAIRLRSDVERKRLFGLNSLADSRTSAGKDLYVADVTQQTYQRIYDLARGLLLTGSTVIVDAAFLKYAEREHFFQLAAELAIPFAIVSLRVSNETLCKRILQRQAAANDASEADLAVLDKLQKIQDPLSIAEQKFTAEFINEAEGFSDSAAGWNRLHQLISRPAQY